MSLEAIARAWMASPHWGGWRKGMVDMRGVVCVSRRVVGGVAGLDFMGNVFGPRSVPDLNHLGTRAYLKEDARTAHKDPSLWVGYEGDDWEEDEEGRRLQHIGWRAYGKSAKNFWGATETEAWLAALQAAPEAA